MLDKPITKAIEVISLFRLQTTELIKMFLTEANKQCMQLTVCNDQCNCYTAVATTPMETYGTLNIETQLKRHTNQNRSNLRINGNMIIVKHNHCTLLISVVSLQDLKVQSTGR